MHLQIYVLYLFNISEYKAMLIKLLIYHRNIYFIHICVCMYACMHVYTVGTESIQTPLNFSLIVILLPFAKII